MAFDGNGNYQLPSPEYPFIPNTAIVAEDMNNVLSDIAGVLSKAFLKDGSSKPIAAMSFNGQKITELATGTQGGDAVNYAQVFTNGVFTGPSLKASPAFDAANGLLIPTIEWVRNLAFSSALPGQSPAQAGFFLQTDGSNASFATVDGRGHSFLNKGNSGTGPVNVTYAANAESQRVTITGQTVINVSGFPADRTVVMLLTLVNAGLFPPTWTGIVWMTPTGSESANFADAAVTWNSSGRDRVVICSEPGLTPWARVVR